MDFEKFSLFSLPQLFILYTEESDFALSLTLAPQFRRQITEPRELGNGLLTCSQPMNILKAEGHFVAHVL